MAKQPQKQKETSPEPTPPTTPPVQPSAPPEVPKVDPAKSVTDTKSIADTKDYLDIAECGQRLRAATIYKVSQVHGPTGLEKIIIVTDSGIGFHIEGTNLKAYLKRGN